MDRREFLRVTPLVILSLIELSACSTVEKTATPKIKDPDEILRRWLRALEPTPAPVFKQTATFRDLKYLNQKLEESPGAFESIADKTIEKATEFYCKEIVKDLGNEFQYNQRLLKERIVLEPREAFLQSRKAARGCIEDPLREESEPMASYLTTTDRIHIDATAIRETKGIPPLDLLFGTTIHEEAHLTPPIIRPGRIETIKISDKPDDSFLITHRHGFGMSINNPRFNLPGRTCYLNFNGDLEEAVVEDYTIRLMERAGLMYATSKAYAALVRSLRQDIIYKYFSGQFFFKVLEYQQRSQPEQFYEEVGGKLLGVSPSEERAMGREYVNEKLRQSREESRTSQK